MSAPAALNARAISTASSGVMPPSTQSCAEMRTDIGRCLRPHLAHRVEHLQRQAQPVLERSAVVVGALVGERRDERRQQIAVRAVQLEPVEAGLGGEARAADEVVAHAVHVGARHRARPLAHAVEVLLRRCRDQRPVAFLERLVDAFPGHTGRALGAGVAELQRDLGLAVRRGRNRRCASSRRAARCSTAPGSRG